MSEVFGQCDGCGKDLGVGDRMVSLILSSDFVDSELSVQPMETHVISLWCPECVEGGIQQIISPQLMASQRMADMCNVWAPTISKSAGGNVIPFRQGYKNGI